MNVHLYERIWMWAAAGIIALFIGVICATTFAFGLQPPSHIDMIDPTKIYTDPRFAKLGQPFLLPDGTVEVEMTASMFAFVPNEIHVPAGRPIRFRLTSADVTHGFMIAGTNVNSMLVPGYISQFTTVFTRPGDYLIVCHEYCGSGHHVMSGRLIVEASK